MAKRRPKKHTKRHSRSILPRRLRGPVLLAAAIIAAIAGVFALVALGMGTQDDGGIERLAEIDSEGRTLGEPDAPVTIIEFADYQCSHCKEFEQTTAVDLQEEYISTGQARLEFRNMALMGDESHHAAQAAECANDQDKFWDYHDALFEAQRAPTSGAFSPERLVSIAEELELDVDEFTQCMESGKYEELVIDETEAGENAGGSGTPFFVIVPTGETEGVTIRGNRPFSDFAEAIDTALEQASRSP